MGRDTTKVVGKHKCGLTTLNSRLSLASGAVSGDVIAAIAECGKASVELGAMFGARRVEKIKYGQSQHGRARTPRSTASIT